MAEMNQGSVYPADAVVAFGKFRKHTIGAISNSAHRVCAIWYLNIRKLRFFNEAYGYRMGDIILREFTAALSQYVSGRGVFARLGEGRFVAFVEDDTYDDETVSGDFDSMCAELNGRLSELGVDRPLEIAAGVYFLDDGDFEEPDLNFLIDQANLAHRRARELGGARVVFFDYDLVEKQRRENAIEHDLSNAIATGEIEVWMQPLLDFVQGDVIAFEALARWNHERLGRISPSEFIPVIERAGKISELDRHVWNMACSAVHERHLETDEPPVPFSVNVSRAEVLDPSLPDFLLSLQDKYQLPEKTLRLEVTESAYTDRPKELIAAVSKLREAGFVVIMDDFGSGYSSLNMLRNLPVDVLKLDMGFLRNEESDSHDAVILNSVIRMAHGLGMPVIAEGVETLEQAEMLKTMGCRFMQGFFFAHPMPVEQFFKLLDDTKLSHHTYPRQVREDKVAQLLDQRSDTAFFFNNCVGPAIVFSASPERYEIMLANDEFYDELQIDAVNTSLFRTDLLEFIEPECREAFIRATKRAAAQNTARCIVKIAEKGKWVDCFFRFISEDEGGGVLACYVRNATEEHELQRELRGVSDGFSANDNLTDLLTFHSFDTLIGGDLGSDGGALYLCEIDGFGEPADGDNRGEYEDLVMRVTNILTMNLPKDALLARCGDCLFAAFLPGMKDASDIRVQACKLIDAIRSSNTSSDAPLACSFGISLMGSAPQEGRGGVYRHALQALAVAKRNGGDGFLLYETIRERFDDEIGVFAIEMRHSVDGELLPPDALKGADLFEAISRDFEDHHSWNMSKRLNRSVRDSVFGALRYRSMAEIPGIISFDYDVSDDCMFIEAIDEGGNANKQVINDFHERLYSLHGHIAAESITRLSTLISDLEYLPVSGNVDLKCRLNPNSEYRWYRYSFTSLRDDGGSVIRSLGYGEDIDLSREAGMWWKERAMHDGLTGLLNREGLEEAIESNLLKRPGGMMFIIDVDDFKTINDTLGHLSGDSVLCELADTLLALFRDHDVVGRYGADELIAFISGLTDRALARTRAQTMLEMADDITVGSYGNITASVGVATIDSRASFYDYLELADHALHVSKANGKNCYTVADEIEHDIEIHQIQTSARGGRSEQGHRAMQVEARYNRERANGNLSS